MGYQNEESNNSEGSSTIIADEGEVIIIVPEDQRFYLDENTWIDGTGLHKIIHNKEDEIVVDCISFPIRMMILK